MVIRIDYLDPTKPIVNKDGTPAPHFLRWSTDVLRRLGGDSVDAVANATATANEGSATAAATQAGAPTGFTLDPTQPLTQTNVSAGFARINVAAHDRIYSGGPTVSLNSGSVSPNVARGFTYYVYYSDPADAGGTVTYLSTEDPTVITADPVNLRLVNSIFVTEPPPSGGGGGGGGPEP